MRIITAGGGFFAEKTVGKAGGDGRTPRMARRWPWGTGLPHPRCKSWFPGMVKEALHPIGGGPALSYPLRSPGFKAPHTHRLLVDPASGRRAGKCAAGRGAAGGGPGEPVWRRRDTRSGSGCSCMSSSPTFLTAMRTPSRGRWYRRCGRNSSETPPDMMVLVIGLLWAVRPRAGGGASRCWAQTYGGRRPPRVNSALAASDGMCAPKPFSCGVACLGWPG